MKTTYNKLRKQMKQGKIRLLHDAEVREALGDSTKDNLEDVGYQIGD